MEKLAPPIYQTFPKPHFALLDVDTGVSSKSRLTKQGSVKVVSPPLRSGY